ncbi:hypothetical protein Tco_1070883, partial [Tanacetum coccineum]
WTRFSVSSKRKEVQMEVLLCSGDIDERVPVTSTSLEVSKLKGAALLILSARTDSKKNSVIFCGKMLKPGMLDLIICLLKIHRINEFRTVHTESIQTRSNHRHLSRTLPPHNGTDKHLCDDNTADSSSIHANLEWTIEVENNDVVISVANVSFEEFNLSVKMRKE